MLSRGGRITHTNRARISKDTLYPQLIHHSVSIGGSITLMIQVYPNQEQARRIIQQVLEEMETR
jgi:hypothetical protein